jgi:hypothetical protein
MPTYQMQAPTGRTFTVDSEQELHQDEVYAHVLQQIHDEAARGSKLPELDATQGMSMPERLAAGFSGGVRDVGLGMLQLGLPKSAQDALGYDDQYVTDKRARDAALVERDPYWGRAAKVTGQTIPTLGIPVTKIPGVGSSLLPRAVGQVTARRGLGTAMQEGAAAGAVQGAVQPTTSDESRLANTGFGAAVGGVLPVGWRVLKAAGLGAARLASPKYNEKVLTERAGERLRETLGADAAKMANQLDPPMPAATLRPRPEDRIPLTAAQKTGDSRLAALERGSNKNAPVEAADFNRAQNEAVFGVLDKQTAQRSQVDALDATRRSATAPLRDAAMQSASRWKRVSQPLKADAQALIERTAADTPARAVASSFARMLEENPNPGQLYSYLRKLDASRGPLKIGDDAITSAMKQAKVETDGLRRAIRARLNDASDGKFETYMAEFARHSGPVDDAVAAQAVWESLADRYAAREGAVPDVTRNVLRRALESKATENKFGDKLLPQTRLGLDNTMEVLHKIEEPQRTLKVGGTSGGGSNTAMDWVLGHAQRMTGNAMRLTPLIRDVMGKLDEEESRALVGLLQDPQAAGKAIRQSLGAGQAPSGAVRAYLALQPRLAASAATDNQR